MAERTQEYAHLKEIMLAKVIPNKPFPGNRRQSFHIRVTYACNKAASVALYNLAGEYCDALEKMGYTALSNERVHTPVCTSSYRGPKQERIVIEK